MRVTMREVATKAGVSAMTVSRVINESPRVSDEVRRRVEADCGPLPFVLLVNKNDLQEQWAISDAELDDLRQKGWWARSSSARTGEGVEDAFKDLAVRVAH